MIIRLFASLSALIALGVACGGGGSFNTKWPPKSTPDADARKNLVSAADYVARATKYSDESQHELAIHNYDEALRLDSQYAIIF